MLSLAPSCDWTQPSSVSEAIHHRLALRTVTCWGRFVVGNDLLAMNAFGATLKSNKTNFIYQNAFFSGPFTNVYYLSQILKHFLVMISNAISYETSQESLNKLSL